MSDKTTKSIANEIVLDADAETVWRAISEGEELKRWFTLDARVRPGAGGAIRLSFGEGAEWESPIRIWEPNRHLRTEDPPPGTIAVDYFIESRGGETVLRVVQSGFGADAWDDEIEITTNYGWRAFLANLRHYLSRHRGEPRTLVSFRHPPVPMPREEAFARMLGAFGFPTDGSLSAGRRYAATTAAGERLSGVVEVFGPPVNLTATVEDWSDGFLIIEIEPGQGQCRPAAWISLYGDAGREAPAMQRRLETMVTEAVV